MEEGEKDSCLDIIIMIKRDGKEFHENEYKPADERSNIF